MTTDMGTEMGIGELPNTDVRGVFEGGSSNLDIDFDAECDESPKNADAQAPSYDDLYSISNAQHESFLWPFMVVIPGLLHIAHNLAEEGCKALPIWSWFSPLLKPVSSFFHSKESKDNFVEKCVKGTDQEDFLHALFDPSSGR